MIISSPQKVAILSLDGINLASGFISKELSIFLEDERTSRHYVFKIPIDLQLTSSDRKTEYYHHQILGGLRLSDNCVGSLEYYSHVGIIQSLSNYTVYVVGHVALKFVTRIISGSDVYDIRQIAHHQFPKQLPQASCGVHHNPRYCSNLGISANFVLTIYFDINV